MLRRAGWRACRSGFRSKARLVSDRHRRTSAVLLSVRGNDIYISDGGNVAGPLTGSYELLFAQRWVVQPEAELNFYSKDDPARRIGSDLSNLDTCVRLRYEISRKFAPDVGFAYNGKYDNTANYARQAGESISDPRFVFGLRL